MILFDYALEKQTIQYTLISVENCSRSARIVFDYFTKIGGAFRLILPGTVFIDCLTKPVMIRPLQVRWRRRVPSCANCFDEASFEAVFELDSFAIVQRYCARCMVNAEYQH